VIGLIGNATILLYPFQNGVYIFEDEMKKTNNPHNIMAKQGQILSSINSSVSNSIFFPFFFAKVNLII
jgi:hypothetical protein